MRLLAAAPVNAAGDTVASVYAYAVGQMPPPPGANPAAVTVHVSNSTSESCLGSTATTELQTHGFVVDSPDDYPTTMDTTTVMYSPGNEQAAATVAAAFGNPHVERVSGLGQEVHVVLGADFATIGAPPPSGSPVTVSVTHEVNSAPTHLPEDLTVTNGADTTCE